MTRSDLTGTSNSVFDAIAKLLEPGQREYFYQRMLHFRHLRPDDELLRIVEAIGFLALVIREAPHAVAIEREQFATSLATTMFSIQATAHASQAYQQQLDDRLSKLPAEIAKGINPQAISQAIAESLRQQFVQSGLPATATALAAASTEMNRATRDYQRAAGELAGCTGVTAQARRAVDEMTSSVARATAAAREDMTIIAEHFRLEYTRSIALMCGAALLLGVLLGFVIESWRASGSSAMSPPTVVPAIESAPPSASPSPKPASNERKSSTPPGHQ